MKFYSILISFLLLSCTNLQDQKHASTSNGLIYESSPYLLQHAHNPVNWQPWKDSVLEQAEQQDKLLIISIGYAACHWCHVMEQESFEDSLVAVKMNDSYFSIKVDREERPDIDQVYMNAAQLLNGEGGWPLNIIALPDGKPVFAGTYFPKEKWIKVIEYFSELYEKEPQRLITQAEKITQGINEIEQPTFNSEKVIFNDSLLADINTRVLSQIDIINGGKKGQQKFPMPSLFEYLLTQDFYQPDSKLETLMKTTLEAMAIGGIYDHLGGGFSRYSVDERWEVPHFEKMLYDNAQLISLYSHAYQKYHDPLYKEVVKETIAFCNQELRDESGAYYSSIDADSEGVEGKYYVWSEHEIDSLLGEEALFFKSMYGIHNEGNFEGKYVLNKKMTAEEVAELYQKELHLVKRSITISEQLLRVHRNKRVKPKVDDKSLTSWNALMMIGLLDAYATLGDSTYLDDAIKTANYIQRHQIKSEGEIQRNFKDGKSSIHGFLDDYAFTALAFIKLYENTFDEFWLYKANAIKEYVNLHFRDKNSQMYYYTSDQNQELIVRKMDLSDNVIPSSNSAMANVLLLLGQYLYLDEDVLQAKQMIANSKNDFSAYPAFYSNWLRLYSLIGHTQYEVAIVGPKAEEKRVEIAKHYLPNKILLGGKDEGSLKLLKGKSMEDRTYIFICKDKSCRLPLTSTFETLKQLKL
ncbi:thioredoxin domain-containing protein [Flammeovirga sp. EKP202]|uniref:thioredoxin domain-containing protein n=1 Tax=Flammeovirga sp. EKP202 TaxID=2770592 RepID=UPI00165F5FA0|nr:thioredoxin domain-containing protein [Flammeovirga sp. EKP202]MBD0401737.1 thioredoxin domain-containing protein [Flammeovirga sp. EKP202]